MTVKINYRILLDQYFSMSEPDLKTEDRTL